MDNLVYEESLNTEIDQSEFISKRWIYVNDNNNGNYTSQVVIDSTPLSNAGGWINWSEGFILMPLVVQLTSADPASLPRNVADPNNPISTQLADYSWAFKNGFWNLINSMSVEFNNQNIIQQTPFLNVFRSFKAHTSFSQDDLLNEGSSIGYWPDSAGSWAYQNDATSLTSGLNGRGANIGVSNNICAETYASFNFITNAGAVVVNNATNQQIPSTGIAGIPTAINLAAGTQNIKYAGAGNPSVGIFNENSVNVGMRKRQTWYGYDGDNNSTGQTLVNNSENCNSVYRSCKRSQTQSGSVIWNVYAKLRLKDLAEFFEKCPLLKGSTMRFYINTNQSIVNFSTSLAIQTINSGALTQTPLLVINSVNVVGGLTNPLMIASNQFGQGC